MKKTNQMYICALIIYGLACLPGTLFCGPVPNHAQDYYDETKLMKDFFNVSTKADEPISYWISQLIGIFEKKHTAKELTKKLKAAKTHPEKVFKILSGHADSSTSAIRQFIYSFGLAKAQKALEQRLTAGVSKPTVAQEVIQNPVNDVPAMNPLVSNVIQVHDTAPFLSKSPIFYETLPLNVIETDSSFLTARNYCALSLVALAALWFTYRK